MSLRFWIALGGAVLVVAGVALGVASPAIGPAIFLGVAGIVVLAGTLLERTVYRRPDRTPPQGPDWQPTGERFRDPVTRVPVEVFYNAATGERRYVRAAARD